MFKKIVDKIPDTILAVMAAFSMTYAVTSSMGLTFPPAAMIFYIILITVILHVSFFSKQTAIAAGILSGAALIFLSAYLIFFADHEKLLEFFDDYSYWLYDFIMYPDVPDQLFQLITVISLCLAFTVFSFIFVIKKFKFLIFLAAGISIFAVQASYGIVVSYISFYLFLLTALILYLKHVYLIKNSNGLNDYARPSTIMLWSIPVSLIIILLSSQIHASDLPIQWKWLDDKIVTIYNNIKNKFDYESFDYFSLSASSGFGDRNSILGGRVRLDRTNVLRVTTSNRVYLRGVSKDLYTGTKWLNSVEGLSPADPDHNDLYDDTDEMMLGMKLLSGEDNYLTKYFDTTPITVTFLNLKTKSLFIPSKINGIDFDTGNIDLFVNDTGDHSSGKRLTRDFQYSMTAYSPRIWSEEFVDILRKSKKGLYSEYLGDLMVAFPNNIYSGIDNEIDSNIDNDADIEFNIDNDRNKSVDMRISIIRNFRSGTAAYNINSNEYQKLEELNEKSKLIYEKYLQLPEDLPQRVKDLAASLVVSSDNNYDKAKAIEKYVAGNYAYNLDVRSTPRNRDFVDYFLFDQQEGYCSYFASAMTILARCAGLPARYVEGYMLPPGPLEDNRNMYIVTNMQAHAWVEIYFEGYGWLPFEPTAPFRSTFYAAVIPEQVYYGTGYNQSYEDYMEMMMRYQGQGGHLNPLDLEYDNEDQGLLTDTIILISVSSIVGLFLLLLLFNKIRSRVRLFMISAIPARESILRFYDYYIRILKLCGFELEPAETPYQYSEKIDKQLFFSPVRFKAITDIFVKARYSRQEPTEKEKQLYVEFIPGFHDEIKINMGKLRYFALKYILGRI